MRDDLPFRLKRSARAISLLLFLFSCVCFPNRPKRERTRVKGNKRGEVCPSLFTKWAKKGTNAGKREQTRVRHSLFGVVGGLRIDLHEHLERSVRMHFDSLSRSNVKYSGLYMRRRRERG